MFLVLGLNKDKTNDMHKQAIISNINDLLKIFKLQKIRTSSSSNNINRVIMEIDNSSFR